MNKLIVLSDSLRLNHSFWIRLGQYLDVLDVNKEKLVTDKCEAIKDAKENDVIIIYRHQERWGDISLDIKEAVNRGVKVVSDVDDYLWYDGIDRGWSISRLKNYTKTLKQCQLITCSTKALQEQLMVMFRDQKVVLVENTAPRILCTNKEVCKKVRIGWTGAPWTRPADLKLLQRLKIYWEKRKDIIQLVHIGHIDKYLSFAKALDIDERLVDKIPLQNHSNYLRTINFDIGLAPLENSCFNKFKSAIKVMEYSANKIPWVASNVDTYKELCSTWNFPGRLCDSDDDWIMHINDLIENERSHEGERLKDLCLKHHSFEKGKESWEEIIEKI